MALPHHLYILLIAFIAAIGGFLLGFDGSVISGALPFYKTTFGLSERSFLFGFSVSCILWGSIFGNLIAGPLSDRIGRKPSLLISAVLFGVSSVMAAMAPSITMLIAGRLIAGVAVGISILVAPVYIAEIAPAKNRGWLVSFNQLLIVIGLSAAYFSNYFILKLIPDPAITWRWMLGVEAFPSILYFVLLLFIPESPRWLMLRNQEDKARKIMISIGGVAHAEREVAEIKNANLHTHASSLREQFSLLFQKKMRFVLIMGAGLAVFQQVSGINAILYYAPMIFESTGVGRDSAFIQSAIIGTAFVATTIVSMFLIDRVGRKPLLYVGVSIMAVALITTGFVFQQATYALREDVVTTVLKENQLNNDTAQALHTHYGVTYQSEREIKHVLENAFSTFDRFEEFKTSVLQRSISLNTTLILVCIILFIIGFSISLGPVMWAMFSEIFPTHLRGFAISCVGTLNALTSFLVATFFPIQLSVFGSSTTYYMYGGLMLACLLFVKTRLVETKGKSLEQIEVALIH